MSEIEFKIILLNLFQKKNNLRNIFYIKKLTHIKNKIKKNSIFIFYGKTKLLNFLYFFYYSLLLKIKFHKNFIIFYEFKNFLTAHNFFPDWPGNYLNQSFIKNLFLWLKFFLYFFVFQKKIYAIILRIN